jgi:hypothetical protein
MTVLRQTDTPARRELQCERSDGSGSGANLTAVLFARDLF